MARNGNKQIFLTQIICTVKTYHIIVFKTVWTDYKLFRFCTLIFDVSIFVQLKVIIYDSHTTSWLPNCQTKRVLLHSISIIWSHYMKFKVVQKYLKTYQLKLWRKLRNISCIYKYSWNKQFINLCRLSHKRQNTSWHTS